MKKILSILLILLSIFSYSQTIVLDSSASVIAYWHKGDTKTLNIVQQKEKYRNGKLVSSSKTSYQVEVKVLKETKKEYTIEWLYKDNNSSKDEDEVTQAIANITNGLKVVFKTDEMGSFKELVNWKEMRSYANEAMEETFSQIKKRKNYKSNPAYKQLKAIFQTKEGVEQLLVRDIQLYHSPHGGLYNYKEVLEFETELPNVFGGEPFPSVMKVELTELSPVDNYGKLIMEQTMDKEKGSEIIYAFVTKLMEASGKPLKEDMELPQIDLSDYNEFEIELESGWLTRAYYQRTALSDNIKQVETMEIIMQ